MKVALCQMNIAFENKQANYIKAGQMIESAVEQGAQMILFPEMSFTGFSMNTGITAEQGADSATCHLIRGYAERFRVAIGYGWVRQLEDGMCENHYTVLSDQGDLLCDYVKMHPFSFAGEDLKFVGGNEAVTFEYKGKSFGVAICYDLRFPELFTELSKRAETILVAANWPSARAAHWKCLLQARAIETQSYVIGVNCVGSFDNSDYSGDSMVVDPTGNILITRNAEEIILMADVGADALPTRLGFPVRTDRKEQLYRTWYEKEER